MSLGRTSVEHIEFSNLKTGVAKYKLGNYQLIEYMNVDALKLNNKKHTARTRKQ